jgi:hemoglobin
MPATQSLYDQLGGEEMVTKTVHIFYKKVLADPRLRPFFENMDMIRLESMQRV